MSEEEVSVNYYGEVFSTSGYATAARGYIRALLCAGVHVAVFGVGRPPPQFQDKLILSLVGRDPNADFTILHAIPLFWPRWVYRTRNVIAVTVWEADPIPQVWYPALRHAVDVWVPCSYNVEVFGKALGNAPFRLPYALPEEANGARFGSGGLRGVNPNDFVFYSIFDWQYRKNAQGMMEAFLRAFPGDCDAVLVLKTIGRAADEARQTLERVRAKTGSRSRVVLFCEAFDEEEMGLLHARGDCYVAAARGTPVIASAQGGPLDFLDPKRHRLVPCGDTPVREPYFLFTREMHWGEPDALAASQALRWVYEHRERARADAKAVASLLRGKYSLQRVGEAAKSRLLDLLRARLG
jgi:glycosyltransferase involved in cell wall biosynthesis